MFSLIPKKLTIGKDIKKINFSDDYVVKVFKNKIGYKQTKYFLNLTHNDMYFPKIISTSELDNEIKMTNCGELLNLYNLPDDWKEQFLEIKKLFFRLNYYILDLRFLPYTPYVVNNICTKDKRLYIVDVTMYKKRSKKYINYKIDFLIKKISIYLYFLNYPIILYFLHIIFELYRLLEDFIEIIFFLDINIFEEIKNILSYLIN